MSQPELTREELIAKYDTQYRIADGYCCDRGWFRMSSLSLEENIISTLIRYNRLCVSDEHLTEFGDQLDSNMIDIYIDYFAHNYVPQQWLDVEKHNKGGKLYGLVLYAMDHDPKFEPAIIKTYQDWSRWFV